MAAIVEIRSYHGTSPDAGTNVASGTLQFKQADNSTVDANNPIPVPGAGTNYSFIKQLRWYVGGTGPSNTINNLKFFTDGANGFGTGVSLTAKTSASYTNPVTQGTGQLAGTTDVFTYTSGSPLSVTGSIASGNLNQAFGDYVQLQMAVASTASQGTTPSETLTFQYDES